MRRTLFEDLHEDFRASFPHLPGAGGRGRGGPLRGVGARGIVPREVFARPAGDGFLGMAVPERYGGGGVDDFRLNP